MTRASAGFTLIEVLIALAITGIVAALAYGGLSGAMGAVESNRETAQRTYELNRAWMMISRDLRHFIPRPIRDEFGQTEAAMTGGTAARFPLSFTRGGWHNPNSLPRAALQRVNYRVEDGTLWRDSYPVLDRAPDTEAQGVELLAAVEVFELVFLGDLASAEREGRATTLDTQGWQANWVADSSTPGVELTPPVALEIRLQLEDLGEIRRIFALPPL